MSTTPTNGLPADLEGKLWAMADKLRGNVDCDTSCPFLFLSQYPTANCLGGYDVLHPPLFMVVPSPQAR